ncbi:MAG: hypothetical protein JW751_07010 [Polyangiaceae bacterium]|nr:hypothetical protein [Polyangiaceae bacterium]
MWRPAGLPIGGNGGECAGPVRTDGDLRRCTGKNLADVVRVRREEAEYPDSIAKWCQQYRLVEIRVSRR